jgi:sucrose-6-phosphate hydrolase SacC (GH32 family)
VQTFSDIPKQNGRRIQMSWMAWAAYPNMPFNQQLSFPCELILRDLPEGLRLCRRPVREIAALRGKEHSWKNLTLNPDDNPLQGLSGDLFEIQAEIDVGQATDVSFKLRGEPLNYSLADRKLSCLGQSAPLDPIAHRLKFQILLDRTSIEVFANDGRVSMSSCFLPNRKDHTLEIHATNGPCKITRLNVYELRSLWPSVLPTLHTQ